MASLPDDIVRHIFSFLPRNTLLNCRLLGRASNHLATALAFQHVRLETFCDPLPFVRISESPSLQPLVREITIDLFPGALPDEQRSQVVLETAKFLLALPRMSLFSALQTANIRFKPHFDSPVHFSGQPFRELESQREKQNFQLQILSVVIQCITGQWTSERHEAWRKSWLEWFTTRISLYQPVGELQSISGDQLTDVLLPLSPGGRLQSLSSLTIANLPDTSEHVLYQSPEFHSLLSSTSLSALKIMVALEKHPFNPSEEVFLPNKYDFFEELPTMWLSPALTANLRVLSLYCREYFGWVPKLDFRMLSPSDGTSALPNLRVLALGNYVFSHDWQFEWIASLGADNGRGGLEALYLDGCPIMWRAHFPGPMDESISDSQEKKIDNFGYPLKEVMTRQSPYDELWDPITVKFSPRWCKVLRTWRDKMKALKVFRMGVGDGEGEHTTTVAMARTNDLAGDLESRMASQPGWKRRCEDMVHLNYDKPSLAECLQCGDSNSIIQYGLGLCQRREYTLLYVHFHVGMGWVERDFKEDMMNEYEDGWLQYGACRKADEEALRELSEAVASRSRR